MSQLNCKAYAPFELKAVDEKARTFTGLASTWDVDLDGDRIQKGAFKKTLKDWQQSEGKKIIPLIDQHNYNSVRAVFGKAESLEETDEGLEGTFSIVPTPDGDEYLSRIKGGYLNGLSIGFQTVQTGKPEPSDEGKSNKVRVITEVRLMEISAVIWGANPEAIVDTSAVKALLKPAHERALTPEEREKLIDVQAEIDGLLKAAAETIAAETPAPESEIAVLEKQLADTVLQKEQAIKDEDYDAAAVYRDMASGLAAKIERKKNQKQPVKADRWIPDGQVRLDANARVARALAFASRF